MDENKESNRPFRDVPPPPGAPEPPRSASGDAPHGAGTAPRPDAAPRKVRRVGTLTFGLVLVATGALLILRTLLPGLNLRFAASLAPAVLIVLGVEVLLYAARPDVKLKYDGVSIFLCLLVLLFLSAAAVLGPLCNIVGPANHTAARRLEQDYESRTASLLRADDALAAQISDLSVSIDLNHLVDNAAAAAVQDGDQVMLYLTVWPEACPDSLAFASMARSVIDQCEAAGLPFTSYRFDTLQRNLQDGDLTFELTLDDSWQADATAEALARNVYQTYWYDGEAFSSYDDMADYRTEVLRDNLSESYADEFGDYPTEEWLDEQMAGLATAETAAA